MILTTSWDIFSMQIDNFVNEGQVILKSENSIKTDAELESTKKAITELTDRCYNFLKSSFDIENNDFAKSFLYARHQRFHIDNRKKDFAQIKKETFEDFRVKFSKLPYFKKILNISDSIIKPGLVKLSDRNSFSTEETLELILDKLFDLYDNNYHSISMILQGNGITVKRHGEERELAKLLEDKGYLSLMHIQDTAGKLTVKGKMYIEDKRRTYKENYEDINRSREEINSKVDEIIETLTKLGYGQEIIFDEIQELKELYTTLNKKNWGQVVKGKLVDLALAKLIENDTVKYIYETLTDHKLRLPSL
jgi:hypothetical protein